MTMEPVNPLKHFGGKDTTEKIQKEELERTQAIKQETAERAKAGDEEKKA